jgi:hypothetical protein
MAGDESFQGVTVHSTFQVVWLVDMNKVALILGGWASVPNSRDVATQVSHFSAFGVGEETHRDGGLPCPLCFMTPSALRATISWLELLGWLAGDLLLAGFFPLRGTGLLKSLTAVESSLTADGGERLVGEDSEVLGWKMRMMEGASRKAPRSPW